MLEEERLELEMLMVLKENERLGIKWAGGKRRGLEVCFSCKVGMLVAGTWQEREVAEVLVDFHKSEESIQNFEQHFV